jgi:hypothetical protein
MNIDILCKMASCFGKPGFLVACDLWWNFFLHQTISTQNFKKYFVVFIQIYAQRKGGGKDQRRPPHSPHAHGNEFEKRGRLFPSQNVHLLTHTLNIQSCIRESSISFRDRSWYLRKLKYIWRCTYICNLYEPCDFIIFVLIKKE